MKSRAKLNITYVILGILMQGPAHGYRIKKLFAPFIAKEGINDGQLYPVLTRLENEKLLRKEIVPQHKSPNKNLYHLTEEGRAQFNRWLSGPEDEIDPVKYDFFLQYAFLVKCIFLEHLSKTSRIKKLRRQIEHSQQKISEYQAMRQDMRERGLNEYKLKIVDFGIELQQVKMRWVEDLLQLERTGEPHRQNALIKKTPPIPMQPVAFRSRRPRKKG